MKITFLGTAAIGYPLSFCNCDNCQKAKLHRGKSLRKRASLLINDELIIDLGPEVQTAMMMYEKDMGKVKYLLQTHPHLDHYNEENLISRIPYMAMKNQHILDIVAHPICLQNMSDRISRYENADLLSEEGKKKLLVNPIPVESGNKINLGDYQVKAIRSTHDEKHGSLLFVVSFNNKHLFYATDTKELTEDALNDLSEYKLDMVILDHTFGYTDYSFSHLNIPLFIKQIEKLKELNIIDENTKIYGTHISHDGLSYHEEIEEDAMRNGYHIAYDGLEIEV